MNATEVKKLERAIIKLSGVFPEEMDIVKGWLQEVRKDAIAGAVGHKEESVSMRFLGRYSAVDDILNYLEEAIRIKK